MLDCTDMELEQHNIEQSHQNDNLNYSGRRLKFFGLNDCGTYYSIERAQEVLQLFSPDNSYSVTEVIELNEASKFIENEVYPEQFSEVEKSEWVALVPELKAAAGRFFNKLKDENFHQLIQGLEPLYLTDLLELLAHFGLYKRTSGRIVLKALVSEGYPLWALLGNSNLVKTYTHEIVDLISTDPAGPELIIRKHLEQDASDTIYLPANLSIEQQKEMVRRYLVSEVINPNLVELISKAPTYENTLVDARMKLQANKVHELWLTDFFKNRPGMEVGYESLIVEDQLEPVIVVSEDTKTKASFSHEWLEETLDPPSILNNFIYLFEFADQSMRLNYPSFSSEMGALERLIGIKGTGVYPQGIGFRTKSSAFLGNLMIYERFLRKNDRNLEEIIQWFFEEYLQAQFQASNFAFSPSSDGATFLEKCRHLFAEMDGILKQFTIFVEEGELDPELLSVTSNSVKFKDVPSLVPGKYTYLGTDRDMHAVMAHMFSDQSSLLYLDEERQGKSGAELIYTHKPAYAELTPLQESVTDFLVQQEILEIAGGILTIKNQYQMRVLRDIFEKGAASYYFYGPLGRKSIDQMMERNWLSKHSSLLTEQEASYYNFVLNQVEYTDGPDLRNKYMHGSQLDSADKEEHYSTYLAVLKLLVGLVIKINDEFCIRAKLLEGAGAELST